MTKARARRGSQVVEAGLVLPILFGLIFAVFDWSWLMFYDATMRQAALEGARMLAGVTQEEAMEGVAETAVRAYAARMHAHPDDVDVETSVEVHDYGRVVTLTVRYHFVPPIGLGMSERTLRIVASQPWYGWMYDE